METVKSKNVCHIERGKKTKTKNWSTKNLKLADYSTEYLNVNSELPGNQGKEGK